MLRKHNTALITGASGFVGGAITEGFLRNNWNVITSERGEGAALSMDFGKPELILNQSAKQSNIDVCVHVAAANELICKEQPILSMKINVVGVRALVDWCIKSNVKRFIYISTFHVFGSNEGELTESELPEPLNDYGLTHFLAEETLLMFDRKRLIDIAILRPSNLVGVPKSMQAFNRWTLAPFDFCRQAAYTGKISLNTCGLQTRNWVDLSYLVHQTVSQAGSADRGVLNICGVDLTVLEMAYLIATSWGRVFGGDIDVVTPKNTSSLDEPLRKFSSKYLPGNKDLNIDDFVLSVGSYLIENSSGKGRFLK